MNSVRPSREIFRELIEPPSDAAADRADHALEALGALRRAGPAGSATVDSATVDSATVDSAMPRANSADSRAGGGRLLLTNLGVRLAQLPVSPPLGKALLCGAAFGCLTPVSLIAAATDGDAMGLSLIHI